MGSVEPEVAPITSYYSLELTRRHCLEVYLALAVKQVSITHVVHRLDCPVRITSILRGNDEGLPEALWRCLSYVIAEEETSCRVRSLSHGCACDKNSISLVYHYLRGVGCILAEIPRNLLSQIIESVESKVLVPGQSVKREKCVVVRHYPNQRRASNLGCVPDRMVVPLYREAEYRSDVEVGKRE